MILFVVAIFFPLATAQSTNNAFKGWFLAQERESCTAACAHSSLGACNEQALPAVNNSRKVISVANYLGKTCGSWKVADNAYFWQLAPMSWTRLQDINVTVTTCYYWNSSVTVWTDPRFHNCDWVYHGTQRFCCCGPTSQCSSIDCFSGDNLLSVRGKGSVQMAQLLVGDYVKTLDGSYALVYAFSHYNPLKPANFISLTTESNASPSHMFLFNGEYAPAETAGVGDQVFLSDGSLSTITAVTIVQRTGIYAPLTESGNLFVSDILASSYTADLKTFGSAQWFAHYVHAPFRWYCMNVAVCHEYTEDGFSTVFMGLEKVYQALRRASQSWQLFITTLGYMIVGTFWFLETMVAGWTLLGTLGVFLGFAIVAIDRRDLLQSAVSSHRKND